MKITKNVTANAVLLDSNTVYMPYDKDKDYFTLTAESKGLTFIVRVSSDGESEAEVEYISDNVAIINIKTNTSSGAYIETTSSNLEFIVNRLNRKCLLTIQEWEVME